MKLLYSLFCLLLINQIIIGQQFSFPMYLEDANGNRDTLVFGYDSLGTNGIDVILNEENIILEPWDTIFDARIIQPSVGFNLYNPESSIFQTKKQIRETNCTSQFPPFLSAIQLNNVNYPLNIYWDNIPFSDSCRNGTLITDWHPGGWFDALHGTEQGPFMLNSTIPILFNHTTHHLISSSNDTTDILFFVIGGLTQVFVNVDEIENTDIKIYPNPTPDFLRIELQNPNDIINRIQLFDISGKERLVEWDYEVVDLQDIPNGFFLLKLTMNNGQTILKKIIKK